MYKTKKFLGTKNQVLPLVSSWMEENGYQTVGVKVVTHPENPVRREMRKDRSVDPIPQYLDI